MPTTTRSSNNVGQAALLGHPRLALALIIVILGLAGLASIPPIDRDEPEFAQAAKQMIESGDFVDIRFQREPLYEKPVLTYWLQAASAAVFAGPQLDRIWAYRLPSLLAIVAAVLLTYELGLALFGKRSAFAGAALLASMLLVQSQAHQARADALLLASMLGCVLPLARAYVARATLSAPMAALFWLSLAASILIKGPVVPALIAVAMATLVLLEREWRWLAGLRPRWGVPLLLLVLLPWPIAILSRHGAAFFVQAWQTDILPKLTSGQEGHGAPPLAYALSSPLILWPASLLLPSALEFAWRKRHEPSVKFCIASVLPGWILFELAPTKLPHYVLPLVPMLVLLMAASPLRSRISARIGAALFLFASLAMVAGVAYALARLGGGIDWVAALAIVALFACAIAATISGWRASERSALAAALCGALATVLIFGVTLPRLDRLWVAQRAARVAQAHSSPGSSTLVVRYHEPSLVFLLGTNTRLVDANGAAAALKAESTAAAIVASPSAAEFVQAARTHSLELERVAAIDGIDPVHGKPIQLGVWRAVR
jgi:4-amino-4-deoxy-L-arabinose transferase-like glycosyltransferase